MAYAFKNVAQFEEQYYDYVDGRKRKNPTLMCIFDEEPPMWETFRVQGDPWQVIDYTYLPGMEPEYEDGKKVRDGTAVYCLARVPFFDYNSVNGYLDEALTSELESMKFDHIYDDKTEIEIVDCDPELKEVRAFMTGFNDAIRKATIKISKFFYDKVDNSEN
jgi:hypothetical protein